MIHGRFGELTRPFVSASVIMPSAGRTAKINFLLDTGADATCLMPADVFALRLDELNWGSAQQEHGIGGSTIVYYNHATLSFLDLGVGLVIYDTPVHLYPNQQPYLDYPSLLGRGVLNHWRIRYSHSENALTAEALRHDLLIPLPISPDRPG